MQPLLELFKAMELSEIINQYIPIYVARGYTIAETIQAIVIMQHAGGEALDHLNYCKDIFEAGPFEIPIPSPSTARARLNAFDNEEENKRRGHGKGLRKFELNRSGGPGDLSAEVGINEEHRLIYSIENDSIYIAKCGRHYTL